MKDGKKKFMTSKEMKKAALGTLKQHYALLVMVCILAALLHTSFIDAFNGLKSLATGQNEIIAQLTGDSDEAGEDVASTGMLASQTPSDVLLELLTDGVEKGDEISQQIQAQAIENAKDPAFGRTRGYLSAAINSFSSGALWVKVVLAMRQISRSDTVSTLIAILGALLVYLFYWAFIQRFYEAVMCRFFLEARIYKRVPYTRFLYFHQVRRWFRTTKTLVLSVILVTLWSFTIIGGVIKYFQYYMVPYIVAENPDIRTREALRLSRDMMKGHKWDLFVKQLSFIGWDLLDMFTFGLLRILFINPYFTAAMAEYYVKLRDEAKAKYVLNAELLNDTWLYKKADDGSLIGVYAVERAELESPQPEEPPRMGFFNFMADWFGIVLKQTREEEAYERSQATKARLKEAQSVLAKESYPMRLVVAPGRVKDPRAEGIYYMRNYSLTTICFLFLVLSFVGWLWEVSLHLIETGKFVNRGVLHGPWLPIYGTGAVIVLLLLKKLRNNLPVHFAASIILCGFVEYFTGWYLELTHDGQKWWDYSGYFLNLHGRICAEGLLAFGILGGVIIYLLAPVLDVMTRQLPIKAFTITVAVLMCVFLTDNFYSSRHPNTGEGITDIEPGGAETTNEGEESRTDQAIAGVIWPGGLT
ncbi:MAG: DUF975 family protein [Lachnospiraceae bacterium]|nr:DUF975 family protein [Lachnospiraceae bacterium]MEE3456645.1 DUF975 family protein [Lachnospiraceae bacterium]